MVYEIKWECDPQKLQEKKTRDVPIIRNLSDWLSDLTNHNVDDITMIEKNWHIFHVTPGHVIVFLYLSAKDLTPRISYPFEEPKDWPSRPLPPSTEWREEVYTEYWDFLVKMNTLQTKQLISNTYVRIK